MANYHLRESYYRFICENLDDLDPAVELYLDLYYEALSDYLGDEVPFSCVNRAKARLYREIDYQVARRKAVG